MAAAAAPFEYRPLDAQLAALSLGAATATEVVTPPRSYPRKIDVVCEGDRFPRVIGELIEEYAATATIKVRDTAHSVLYRLPIGQPDPQALCTSRTERVDDRCYVRHDAAPDVAEHAAFNMIRFQIGANCTPELRIAQTIEASCLQYCREIGNNRVQCSEARAVRRYVSLPFMPAPIHMPMCQNVAKQLLAEMTQKGREVPALLSEYVTSPQNKSATYEQYVGAVTAERRIEIVRQFFARHNCITIQDVHQMTGGVVPCQQWGEAQPHFYQLYKAAHVLMAKLYGLRPSLWQGGRQNKATIDLLLAELKAKKQLVMQGHFGDQFYSQPAHRLGSETAGGDPVFGWKPGTRILASSAGVPMPIVVTGATKHEGQEYVYYFCPIQSGHSNSDTEQRIFRISYATLRQYTVPFVNGIYAYAGKRAAEEPATAAAPPPPPQAAAAAVGPRVFVKAKRTARKAATN